MPAKENIAAGQPTKYRDEYCEQAYRLCLLGLTDEQLGEYFGVTETTINNWKIAHPEFFESLQNGKKKADGEVAESLYKRAMGYEHPEDKIFHTDNSGVVVVPTIKHYPPDTAAAFIWLKNRANWSDKRDIDIRETPKRIASPLPPPEG